VTSNKKLTDLPLVLTVDEARKVMRIGARQLRQAIARREIYAVKVGRSIRIPRTSIEAWLAGPRTDHQGAQLAVVEGGRRS
jgi:excisionase family DNA binding protein